MNKAEKEVKVKKVKKFTDKGAYVVDEKFRGELTEHSTHVVMDNTICREPKHNNKAKITYFITENAGLFIGNNTVALFKIKMRQVS